MNNSLSVHGANRLNVNGTSNDRHLLVVVVLPICTLLVAVPPLPSVILFAFVTLPLNSRTAFTVTLGM
ncbi:MAG: hypothetical protein IPP73_11250 [Chitinophagaceae bacterium]|nr:hypothetical protein [Chitinophagaceae bacterium]